MMRVVSCTQFWLRIDRLLGPLRATEEKGVMSAPDTAHRARYRRILRFSSAQLAQLWWYELVLPKLGLTSISERTRPARMTRLAKKFHALAVELGGLMIKVGQFLSSRLDVLPPEITQELQGLQDEVPAVPFDAIKRQAEVELGMPLERAYAWFDEVPLAAASLGQAHRARLAPGDAADTGFTDVVVKVQRPGIESIIDVDLAALRRVAQWLRRVRVVASKADVPALVEEFAVTTYEEVDYLHEAANATRFADNFADDPRVATPAIAWERSTRRVLTLSDVTAIKISDAEALRAAGIDPHEVARVFAEVMFAQLFTHSFFHADPHPGNIFVTPLSGRSGADATAAPGPPAQPAWQLTFIDFGMMGEVPESMRDGLRAIVIALAARDGRRLIEGVKGVGALLPTADTLEFEHAITQLFARFGGMGFAELKDVDQREFRDFGIEFGDVIRRMPFQFPEGFLLLLRAVSLTSGMCSNLDPEFNVWDAVEPFSGQLLREEGGNVVQALGRETAANMAAAWRLPQRLDSLITRVDQGEVSFDTSRIERRLASLELLVRRGVSSVLFAALLVGGAMLLPVLAPLGIVLMSVSALPLAHALLAGRWTGR